MESQIISDNGPPFQSHEFHRYRSTPHSTTKILPAQLFYNREIRGKLPSLPRNSKVIDRNDEAKQNDEQQKKRGRVYADMRRKTRPSNINVGDTVLVKQKKTNKFSTNFAPTPYTVVRVKGSKIVTRSGSHYITRNATFFKRLMRKEEREEDESIIDQTERTPLPPQQQEEMVEPRRSTRNQTHTQHYGHPINSSVIH